MTDLDKLAFLMVEQARLALNAYESQAVKLNEIMMRKKPFKIGNGGKPIMMPLEYKEPTNEQR